MAYMPRKRGSAVRANARASARKKHKRINTCCVRRSLPNGRRPEETLVQLTLQRAVLSTKCRRHPSSPQKLDMEVHMKSLSWHLLEDRVDKVIFIGPCVAQVRNHTGRFSHERLHTRRLGNLTKFHLVTGALGSCEKLDSATAGCLRKHSWRTRTLLLEHAVERSEASRC